MTVPALAVMVKFEVFNVLVGTRFDQLPAWMSTWSRVDPSLLSVVDINKDGILQLGEMRIGGDIVVLATPEIAGLPYVISGMVAAGGLAAALSTADGLLLTIANALSHDFYFKMVNPGASAARRVALSKVTLLAVALGAAAVAAQRPADIVFLVSAAFSLAAAAFFPALVLGVFWSRANQPGALAGMVAGLAVTIYYMVQNEPWMRSLFGVSSPPALWFGRCRSRGGQPADTETEVRVACVHAQPALPEGRLTVARLLRGAAAGAGPTATEHWPDEIYSRACLATPRSTLGVASNFGIHKEIQCVTTKSCC